MSNDSVVASFDMAYDIHSYCRHERRNEVAELEPTPSLFFTPQTANSRNRVAGHKIIAVVAGEERDFVAVVDAIVEGTHVKSTSYQGETMSEVGGITELQLLQAQVAALKTELAGVKKAETT